MSNYQIIGTLDVTYADSASRPEFKIKEIRTRLSGKTARKGTGEKRIYVGANETTLDSFFCEDNSFIDNFFIQKKDLEFYTKQVEDEFTKKQTYPYCATSKKLKQIFTEYQEKLKQCDNKIELEFKKKYDNQKRYYLVLNQKKTNREKYDYIWNICLPRVSRLIFIKIQDIHSHEISICIKPFYGNIIKDDENGIDFTAGINKSKGRKKQTRYRYGVLENYPSCVVTGVSDRKLLVACHIKEHSKCDNDNEKYDIYNGFSMTPTIHTLFDLGYLSFGEDGKIQLSEAFNKTDMAKLQINNSTQIVIKDDSKDYLKWHNDNKFIKIDID